jgi:hypothetical protein
MDMDRLRTAVEESAGTVREYTSCPGSKLPEAWSNVPARTLIKLLEAVEATAGKELHDPVHHSIWTATRDLRHGLPPGPDS